MDARGWGAFVFCALNTLAAYGCFAEALAHWEASRVSAVLACVRLGTLALLYAAERFVPGLIAPEPITPVSIAGAALVVVVSLLAALAAPRKALAADAAAAEPAAGVQSGRTSTSSSP